MLYSVPIPAKESSGRHLATSDVARLFSCSAAAVREMVKRGELEPSHTTPGGIRLFHADYIEERARARRLRPQLYAQVDAALGYRRSEPAEVMEVQTQLPLGKP
jgi:DNA-binding transcriptional MerR regulator